ncbi:unnamed protein product, partial [Protopolystoma xenopodis]
MAPAQDVDRPNGDSVTSRRPGDRFRRVVVDAAAARRRLEARTARQSGRPRLRWTLRLGRGSQSTQVQLIIALALVDFATCLVVLPGDLVRTICSALVDCSWSSTSPSPSPSPLALTSASASPFVVTGWRHVLSDLLNDARTFVFACEGSILAAIAVDRFFAVVTARPSRRLLADRQPDVETMTEATVDARLQRLCSRSPSDRQRRRRRCSQLAGRLARLLGGPVSEVSRCRIIAAVVLLPSCGVLGLETTVFLLHSSVDLATSCRLGEQLRHSVNQAYLICSLFSLLVISTLYTCIFFTVRRQDLRKQNWARESRLGLGVAGCAVSHAACPDQQLVTTTTNTSKTDHDVPTIP